MRKQSGFTLIEALMIVFVLGIVVVVGGNLFFSILKGASKAGITKEIKQNGEYTLSVMERMIRNARQINTCTASSIQITNPDNNQTTFTLSGTQIASNGAALTSNLVALVAASSSFACNTAITPPTVVISFILSQAGTGDRPEERSQIPFQTTVSLRTY